MSGFVVALLVGPTLAVTTARLLPEGNLLWVVLRASAPLAIIPYSIALLILVVTRTRLHGRARSVASSALAFVTALLCLHLWWATGPFLAHAEGSPTGAAVAVMTANLHIGRADPERILSIVDSESVTYSSWRRSPPALAGLESAGLGRHLTFSAGEASYGRDGIMVFANRPLREVGQIDTASPGTSSR